MKKKVGIVLVLAAVTALALIAGCADSEPRDEQSPPPVQSAETKQIGEGSTAFVLETTDSTGATTTWNVHTDETTLGAALLDAGFIEGEMGGFGLMIIYVNGERADYNEDGAYWAFLIDGEYAAEGVDATAIEQGRTYALVYTKA